MSLTKDEKAAAINLAMNLELGTVSPNEVLKEIDRNIISWIPILEFWGDNSPLTINALERLYTQKCFNLPAQKGVL